MSRDPELVPALNKSTAPGRVDHVSISTPGRICLFGEHQDYLRLPVIPCAISLRVSLEGRRRTDSMVHIDLPDIGSQYEFSIDRTLPYSRERDYFKSTVNVLKKHGYSFSSGFDCTVRSKIPINAGTSSSSALVVSWVNFLARMSDRAESLSAELCGRYAHEAEVVEFHEPGGMMDKYATSIGGITYVEFHPQVKIHQIDAQLKTFVLGDSGEPKDTKEILARVKNKVLEIIQLLSAYDPKFSLSATRPPDFKRWKNHLSPDQLALLDGTVRNYAITIEARELLTQTSLDERRLGQLLTRHQDILRDVLKISTPKINRMLDAALRAGAYGGKINGSGGGGCMFVYAPEDPERIAEAINGAGGKAYIVTVDAGTRSERGKAFD